MRAAVREEVERILPFIPTSPPEDTLEIILQRGYLKNARLLIGCEWVYDETEGKKVRKVKAVCTECGAEHYFDYVQDGCGRYGARWGFIDQFGAAVSEGDCCVCPSCAAQGQAMMRASKGHSKPINNHTFLTMHKVEGHLALLSWIVTKYARHDGVVFYKADLYEGVIVIDKTVVRIRGYYKYMTSLTWLDHWEYTLRNDYQLGSFANTEVIYSDYSETDGTECEKSALVEYLKSDTRLYPCEYLKLWLAHPNVENLVTASFIGILNEVIGEALGYHHSYTKTSFDVKYVEKCIDFKKNRPIEMLGIDYEDIYVARYAGFRKLQFYKKVKHRYGVKLNSDQLEYCKKQGFTPMEELLDVDLQWGRVGIIKLINYLKRQADSQKEVYDRSLVDAGHLRDYWDLVNRLYHEIPQELAFPKDLKRAHDEVNERVQIVENAKDDLAIKDRIPELERLCFCDSELGLFIRPAASYAEFIREGKQLHHCVARYASAHAKGNTSIFFIRKVSDPDRPFYTLEFRGGCVAQNRGKNNCARTPEVEAFEARWLDYVNNLKGMNNNGKRKDARVGA